MSSEDQGTFPDLAAMLCSRPGEQLAWIGILANSGIARWLRFNQLRTGMRQAVWCNQSGARSGSTDQSAIWRDDIRADHSEQTGARKQDCSSVAQTTLSFGAGYNLTEEGSRAVAVDRRTFAMGGLSALVGGYALLQQGRTAPARSAVIAGYVAPWKARAGGPGIRTIPVRELTHLMYAFGTVSTERLAELADRCLDIGACGGISPSSPLGGNFAQLAELKRDNPQLRILISLGGWNGSKYFSAAAATPLSRARFARSVIDAFFRRYPRLFDGVDIDWEFPVSGGRVDNLAYPEARRAARPGRRGAQMTSASMASLFTLMV
ncbi:hypothetical protein JOH48_002783 [Bradyrhizobium elkanii]|nr:hypothetical protein [Bradyrhizobium elkanii]